MKSDSRIRKKILRAALGVFSRRGYRGSSVDQIAGKAGITKGAIYWHFKNKLDLYYAVCEYAFREYETQVLAGISESSEPGRNLQQLMRRALDFYRNNEDIAGFYSTMMLEGKLLFKKSLLEMTARMYSDYRAAVSEMISAGIQNGEYEDIDPNVGAAIVIAALDGLAIQWMLDKENVDLDSLENGVTTILFQGIKKRH